MGTSLRALIEWTSRKERTKGAFVDESVDVRYHPSGRSPASSHSEGRDSDRKRAAMESEGRKARCSGETQVPLTLQEGKHNGTPLVTGTQDEILVEVGALRNSVLADPSCQDIMLRMNTKRHYFL